MKLLPIADGQSVRVMDATDAQFQTFVQSAGIVVEENGMSDWSFDDRCRLINHALKYGIPLPFAGTVSIHQPEQKQFDSRIESIQHEEQKQFTNNSPGELFVVPKPAPQAEAPQKRLITFADYEAVKKQLGWVAEIVQESNENNS